MKNIRNAFLSYFKDHGHTVVPSDSLVPSSDPTLLFTSAGMVQFKAHFLQQIPLTFTRAASAQRCLRTTDIEQVGQTARHLTLFEMLGNFSFGDYFKEDAIAWGWEFLTKTLALPEKRLWVTIYKDDDEAFKIWKKLVPEKKIVRMGDETNFWTMGPTGPCGPCSEIYWDFIGDDNTAGPDETNRWMEIWNLVFTQFDRQADGKLVPLPKKNIDTGMGLERLTSVVEGVKNNFETSLFTPLIKFGEDLFSYKSGTDPKKDVALKIVADHMRAITLLAYDGILPSNEGRGYVFRRLLRRALRQGSLFGVKDPFLNNGVPLVVDLFKDTAADLDQRKSAIRQIIREEEERFLETLETGSEQLRSLIAETKKTKAHILPGNDVFHLYETYGFPPELTQEILHENNLSFSEDDFKKAQGHAQKKAREGWKGSGAKDNAIYNQVLKETGATPFRGYDTVTLQSTVVCLLKNGALVERLNPGEEGEVVTAESPFYPEGGGQVGDVGTLTNMAGEILADVTQTSKPAQGLIVHTVLAKKTIEKKAVVSLAVSASHRDPTKRHHTATHLLHAALRTTLGKTVTQAGSLVSPERLRFDFTFSRALLATEIRAIEDIVNEAVLKNMPVTPTVTTIDHARKMGAMALFGEKYGAEVRCLLISDAGTENPEKAFSLELCGGTHVSKTGDIGAFKIVSESALAAGVRRIEAVAGLEALAYLRELETTVHKTADLLKSSESEIEARIRKMLDRQKEADQEISALKLKLASGGEASRPQATQTINGIAVTVSVQEGLDVKELRILADQVKSKMAKGLAILGAITVDEGKEKVSFIVVSNGTENAGALAKKIAAAIDGSGGGRPDFAQGGGQNRAKFEAALKNLSTLIG